MAYIRRHLVTARYVCSRDIVGFVRSYADDSTADCGGKESCRSGRFNQQRMMAPQPAASPPGALSSPLRISSTAMVPPEPRNLLLEQSSFYISVIQKNLG